MKKILFILTNLIFVFSGCYKSWNGLNFTYTELEQKFNNLQPFSTEENEAELFAVKYGISEFAESSIYHEGEKGKTAPFDWMFYILKHKDKLILIDTGFSDPKYIRQFGVDHKDPLELLASAGFYPDDITHVIITHSHFDHAGLVNEYTNAEIIINKDAYDFFFRVDRKAAEELGKNKNLTILKERTTLFNSIYIYPVGGHAPGSSAVFFKLKEKRFCLAGDEAYLLSNVTEKKPVGTHTDLLRNKSFLKELSSLKDTRILTFHDPSIAVGEHGVYPVK